MVTDIEGWIHHGSVPQRHLSQTDLANLLGWMKHEIPVSDGVTLKFQPQILHFDASIQKMLLETVLEHIHIVSLVDLGSLLCALKTSGTSDAWVVQLLRLLESKIHLASEAKYNFTDTTERSYSALITRIKERASSKSKGSWFHSATSADRRLDSDANNPSGTPLGKDATCSSEDIASQATTLTVNTTAFLSQSSQLPGTSASMTSVLPSEIQMQVEALRQTWHSYRMDPDSVPQEVHCLITLSTPQLEAACTALRLDELPESSLPTVCQHVIILGESLSHTTATRFAAACLLPRVVALTQNATRSMLSAVSLYTSTYPQPVIEGVLVPALLHHDAAGPQAEIAVRMAKETLKPQNLTDFLSNLVASHEKWNEPVLTLIQALLDAKTSVDGMVLTGLVEQLSRVADSMSSSKPLAKVVLTTIQKKGQQFTISHATGIKQVLLKNKTFLRKPALAALNRLKL